MTHATAVPPVAETENAPDPVVSQLIAKARAAQREFCQQGQAVLDTAAQAAAWAIMEPGRCKALAERAVADTGLGNIDDKIRKNHRKTLGLLRDLHGVKTTGIIRVDPASGITEIARPVGVVAAITPSTNPAATPANKIINALKCGNAIILAPSPKGLSSAELLVHFIHQEFQKCGLPLDLVQVLPAPVSKQRSAELMQSSDLVVVTGSRDNVRMAYTCGTPAFGVGVGNVASIIDASADLDDAAAKITLSKTFDNATSCSSENSVIVPDAVFDDFIAAMNRQGAVLLNAHDKARLQSTMWPNGSLSGKVTGKSAAHIAELSGLSSSTLQSSSTASLRILMVEETGYGPDFPFSGEKLSPVLAVYRASDFNHACEIVQGIYDFMGAGHSVSLHTRKHEQAVMLGQSLPVSRVIVNQAHCLATGGNFDNGLPFSLSMGCGTWGRNNFSENMNYRHYLNITRVATTIEARVPEVDDLLGSYFETVGR